MLLVITLMGHFALSLLPVCVCVCVVVLRMANENFMVGVLSFHSLLKAVSALHGDPLCGQCLSLSHNSPCSKTHSQHAVCIALFYDVLPMQAAVLTFSGISQKEVIW